MGFARLKTGEYFDRPDELIPTTGDFVLLDWNDDGDSRILRTLPRRTFFSRLDPSSAGRREQLVAANFDYVFILQSLNGDFNLNRLERYLTLAWQSGAVPVVVLTKTDLAEEYPGCWPTPRVRRPGGGLCGQCKNQRGAGAAEPIPYSRKNACVFGLLWRGEIQPR
jgi:hypothetical protein